MFGAMFMVPLYYQLVRGEGAVMTGLLLAPQGVGAAMRCRSPVASPTASAAGGSRSPGWP